MNGESLLIFLLVGALAGWLAGLIVKGYGLGLIGNIVVGVIGAFIGGWLFDHFRKSPDDARAARGCRDAATLRCAG